MKRLIEQWRKAGLSEERVTWLTRLYEELEIELVVAFAREGA